MAIHSSLNYNALKIKIPESYIIKLSAVSDSRQQWLPLLDEICNWLYTEEAGYFSNELALI